MIRARVCAVPAPGTGGRLEMIEREVRPPRGREVLIRVHRAGVAFGDILRARSLFVHPSRYPFTPGYDVAGEVIAAGPAAGIAVGQRVVAFTLTGGYSEAVTVARHRVAAIPEGIGYPEAGALVLNYVTAWQMLHRVARVREGGRVLIHGAAGGVGTALLQLGRLHGLRMYGTASRGKHPVVKDLGAVPIDYRSVDFVEAVRRLEPGGLDAVFDNVSIENARRSRALLRRGGVLVYYGFVGMLDDPRYGGRASKLLPAMLRLRLAPTGPRTRIYAINPDLRRTWFREDLGALLALLEQGRLRPLIHRTFPLSRAQEAQEYLLSGRAVGKLLLDCVGEADQGAGGADQGAGGAD